MPTKNDDSERPDELHNDVIEFLETDEVSRRKS